MSENLKVLTNSGSNLPPFTQDVYSVESKKKLDEFFLTFLNSVVSDSLLEQWIYDLKHDLPFSHHNPSGEDSFPMSKDQELLFSSSSSSSSHSSNHATPFTSPRSPSPSSPSKHFPVRSPSSPSRFKLRDPESPSISKQFKEKEKETANPSTPTKKIEEIPRFFFASQKMILEKEFEEEKHLIQEYFADFPQGAEVEDFIHLTKEICGLPSFFNTLLMSHIDVTGSGVVTKDRFLDWWQHHFYGKDLHERFFHLLRKPENEYIEPEDFSEVVRELLNVHPGLEFLQSTPEFQDRYVETVVIRFYYSVNRAGDWRMTLKDLRASNLVEAFELVDEEADVNKVLDFFSYEHFYVLYCKFWELDDDHDLLIDRDDLCKYGNYSLSNRVIDRIFAEVPRPFSSQIPGKMAYRDFIWFMLSEEDKNSLTAAKYWFACADTDQDGYLSIYEMEYFYEEQVERMECLNLEPIPFENVLCQMIDMICPEDSTQISLLDIRKCRMGSNLFNILFNINKFRAIEIKDPHMCTAEKGTQEYSDWDIFARAAYDQLSLEDDDILEGEWTDENYGQNLGYHESPI
eukprot:GCRY01005220.1.p1 GENE.GCRY01005220.1~~GCRY01005220.1.p1  ORF type:complete len:572 (+),score=138.73 GCRY01005220.1:166-1881(+)